MILYNSWLLPATCTIILVVTTYATTTQAAKQKQAEANFQQQVAVSPSRPLKYGDKTTKKLPNQEVQLLPTSSAIDNNKNNANIALTAEKQAVSRKKPRSRIERLELNTNRTNSQISRRNDNALQKQQLDVQHQMPTLQNNNNELFNKSIKEPTVGQQLTVISNRSRSTHTLTQTQQNRHQPRTQPTHHYSHSDIVTERNIAKTKNVTTTTIHKSRQRKPATTSGPTPPTNINQTPLAFNNSYGRAHHTTSSNPSSSNSTIVRNYHSLHTNNNNANTKASNTTATTSGQQSKTKSSSNKQTGNISDNDDGTQNVRSIVRKFKSNASTTVSIISATSTSSTITTATATTSTTTIPPPFQLPNSFNIFTPEFWQFLYPTSSPVKRVPATAPATTTRKPPKKYKPPNRTSTKEEKLNLVKPKPTILSSTTTQQPEFNNYNYNYSNRNNYTIKKDEGPFRIALPTLNILNSKRETHNGVEKDKRNVEKENNLRERFNCPRESEVRFQLFPKICKIDEDCNVWKREEICCDIFGAKSCVSGLPKPLEETSHARVIPRKCPSRPLAELWWEVKECDTDMDCWPRVCCPDGRRRYCRTSQPELNTVPVPVQRSFNYLSEYLECTPAPPPIFDLHPKTCTSTLDCFPNVCCQEAGLRHCRPPKKSVLTMLASVFNVDFVKRLTQNIVIK